MSTKINVTVWNEFRHERQEDEIRKIYPDGLHKVIGEAIGCDDIAVTYATLDEDQHGLTDEVLNNTDVLIWWGHMAHKEVSDEIVDKIRGRVYLGKMNLIVLHSGHHSKVFRTVVGTTGNLSWGRNQKEIVWNIKPTHPITAGIPDHFLLETEELYAEPFFVGEPDETLFLGWYEDGFVMRSGMLFNRGAGRIFYFQPGHEECRSLYNEYVQRIIKNAVYYLKPQTEGYAVENKAPHWTFSAKDEFDK